MICKINNRWPINLPQHRGEFHRSHYDWEAALLDSMFKNVKKDDVMVDVGTELGDYAALFTLWGAKVVCIEPQPKYWPIIRQHFRLNNVKPLACFAGFASNANEANPTLADFEIGNKGLWPKCAYSQLEDWNGFRNVLETGISTPQMRLDQLVNEYQVPPVDVITIDVEGAEFEVLKGAVTILNTQKPLVYVSIHPNMLMHDWSNTKEDIFNYMESLGYTKRQHLSTDHEEHWAFWNLNGRKLK